MQRINNNESWFHWRVSKSKIRIKNGNIVEIILNKFKSKFGIPTQSNNSQYGK